MAKPTARERVVLDYLQAQANRRLERHLRAIMPSDVACLLVQIPRHAYRLNVYREHPTAPRHQPLAEQMLIDRRIPAPTWTFRLLSGLGHA